MKPTNSRSVNSFADIGEVYAEAIASPDYARAFATDGALSQLTISDEPTSADMPEPFAAEQCVAAMIGELFCLMNDTRMQPIAQRIAWGIVNSFHVVARQIESQEDSAAQALGELARITDTGEIHSVELEEKQMLCPSLAEVREAVECMRDHAGEVYRAEAGHPFSALRGSREPRPRAHEADAHHAHDHSRQPRAVPGRVQRRRQPASAADWQARRAADAAPAMTKFKKTRRLRPRRAAAAIASSTF